MLLWFLRQAHQRGCQNLKFASAFGGAADIDRRPAPVITTHVLFARNVQCKRSNGVAGFAAGGSSSDRKRSRPIRALSATPHDGQRRGQNPAPSCVSPTPQL